RVAFVAGAAMRDIEQGNALRHLGHHLELGRSVPARQISRVSADRRAHRETHATTARRAVDIERLDLGDDALGRFAIPYPHGDAQPYVAVSLALLQWPQAVDADEVVTRRLIGDAWHSAQSLAYRLHRQFGAFDGVDPGIGNFRL